MPGLELVVSQAARAHSKRDIDVGVSTELLNGIVRELDDGVIILRTDETIVLWNRWMAAASELSSESVVGLPLTQVVPQLEKSRFHRAVRSALEDGMASLLSQSLNPSPLPLSSSSARTHGFDGMQQKIVIKPLKIASGAFCLIHVTDVSDAVARVRNVRTQSELLARSNAQLQEFANVVSHDFRAPLRMINSFLNLLVDEVGDALSEDCHEYIEYAVGGAGRLGVLLDDLVEYSRVGSRGKAFRPVDLNEVLECAISNLAVTIADTGARIRMCPLPTISGDDVQLTQLFQNLLENAMKYRRPDTTPEITIAASQVGRDCTVSVADDGIGMRQCDLSNIFVMFHRLHRESEFSGTGIGLAICKRIVEKHHGVISAKSAPGLGSTIHCRFPAA